ncbi:MAG: sulfatase [Planctomycetaceae bacterium]
MLCRILAALSIVTAFGTSAPAADRPNFVWLISEDNSKHYLKLFDRNGAETPRIAEMAKQGLLFEHAFSNAPVCSVARTTLITGCYGPRIGTQFHRKSTIVPMPAGLRMFPAYLRKAGYYTTNNRKKDYNAIEGRDVWDASSRRATWRNRNKGQPSFHMQSFTTSHESSLHFTATAMKNQKTETKPESVTVAPYHPDTPTFRYTYARYLDRIRKIDHQIGAVLDKLKDDGLLEETFVFYFGDHGGVLPRSKGYLYESGLHVPLVVRVPKKYRHLVDAKPGTRVTGFVSFIDFGPTLLNLAGIPVPDAVDGRPFLGKGVRMADVNKRDETFGYADRFDEKYDLVRTLRKGRFKYMRSYQPFNFDALQNNYRYRMLAYAEWRRLYREGKLNATQRQFFEPRAPEALYDLAKDPYETRNLANVPKYAATLADLRRRLSRRVKGMPDLSLFPESALVKGAFANPAAFGRKHKRKIAALVDVADLSLVPFEKAQAGIRVALSSKDPWQRYWGLIACSSHGKVAASFAATAKTLAANDREPLVRVRAAEFLGLIAAADPRKTIMDALAKSDSGIEAALILNTLVLLRDGKPGYAFKVTGNDVNPAARREPLVQRRLQYLARP